MNNKLRLHDVERPAKPLLTAEEAGKLLESLRATYQTLDPESRQGVKRFFSELMNTHYQSDATWP